MAFAARNAGSTVLVRETLRVFYNAAREHKTRMVLAFLNPTSAVLLSVAVPFLASKVFAGLAQHDSHIHTYLILLGISSFLGVVCNRVGFSSLMVLQARTMSDLQHMVHERLLKRSVGFHANNISGKLISDALDFVGAFGTLVNGVVVNAISFLAVIIIGVIVVLLNSWELGLFLIATVVITLVWAYFNSRTRAHLRTRRLIATKALTSHLSDTVVNAQTVKTFAGEESELEKNRELNATLLSLRENDWVFAGRSASNRMAVLLGLQFSMVLLVMYLVHHDPATLGTGIFAFTYTFNLVSKLFDISTMTRQAEEVFLNASPMTTMLLEPIEIQDVSNAPDLKSVGGDIRFKDVHFAYQEKSNKQHVFTKFDLHIAPGEKVGLVGPSGGGKSTLTRLLLRFDEIQSGQVLIDDQDITGVTQASLRRAISYVPQEPLLFHRSIQENIAYGNPDATESQIIAAAKSANAHDFISKLTNGYDTVVGERGIKLSGGQRQRIAIARAMLKDAPILVLDEATSALDSENEHEVQSALWELMKGRTTIVIAHRLSTIQKMDRIVVLSGGKIVESGPHEKLVSKKGVYAKLWARQSGGFIED
jgi:ATP-binding cassette subfamily B protein